ncbi:MAG TPA: ATP synthase F1 subunit gamma [Terriglobales bacterium]|nr:ATP synthase F1 subunit gamma [Terriglobales bacterium]
MANVLDIRRRIRSVKNTRQITKAMKMVSAAKLRRAQERALAGRPYAQMLTNVLQSLVRRVQVISPETGEVRHPLLARREEKNILLLVVSGDKGLAGAFSANIMKAAGKFLAAKQGNNIDIEAVGRKGRDYFRRRYQSVSAGGSASSRVAAIQITGEQVGILNRIEFTHAGKLAQKVAERYVRGEIDSAYLLFNEFKSVISQRLVAEQLLPIQEIGERTMEQLEAPTLEEKKHAAEAAMHAGVTLREADTSAADAEAKRFGTSQVDYIYEQPPERLFADLLPKYIAIQIWRGLLESVAAEHAARMTAMDSATNNASDMIDALTLAMNRARQAKITKEIIEIVSGAAAL